MLTLAAVAGSALFAAGQAPGSGTQAVAQGNSVQVAKLPYTAEYRITSVATQREGTTSTTESTEVDAVDSQGRRMIAITTRPSTGDQPPKTQIHVSDPVSHTLSYWSLPGTGALAVNAPDVGEDTECSRKMRAIGPLHPGGVEQPPIKNLGTATILAIPVHGGQVSFMPSIFRIGDQPHLRTNEVWTATDPALDGLLVRVVSDAGPADRSTRELVKFTQAEPDASLFQVPAGRTITKMNGHAYSCGVVPGAKPSPPPPAQ
jgi:hypothetical protein